MLSWVDWCHQKYPQPKRQFGSLDSLSADISVGHAIAPNIKPELCSNFSGNWTARAAPPVGNPMPFLLGNLFCGLHRKSSGTKKKDAQGCGARKEVASLQFGQAGQTNCCQYQVAKKCDKKEPKQSKILKGPEIRRRDLDEFIFQGEEHSSYLLLQPDDNWPGKNMQKETIGEQNILG